MLEHVRQNSGLSSGCFKGIPNIRTLAKAVEIAGAHSAGLDIIRAVAERPRPPSSQNLTRRLATAHKLDLTGQMNPDSRGKPSFHEQDMGP